MITNRYINTLLRNSAWWQAHSAYLYRNANHARDNSWTYAATKYQEQAARAAETARGYLNRAIDAQHI